MSRLDVRRLRTLVAELRADRLAAAAVPLAAEALRAAGFRVYPFDGGMSVDEAPGLDAKLEELEAQGIRPGLVCVLRTFDDDDESTHGAPGALVERAGTGSGVEDPGTGRPSTPGPVTLTANARAFNPTADRGTDE
jgi:D-serine deaminase-like pyridoxal phosphate-dependent protein